MGKLWKNKSLRWELMLCAALTGLLALLGFGRDGFTGLALLGAGTVFTALYLFLAGRRFRAMGDLSERVDRVLHGQDAVLITESEEGELSILESEIAKLTLRLREQTQELRAERSSLARAMEDVSHQLRTPLTALHLEAALLGEEDVSPARRLELAQALRRQLQRMEWLVEALLKMSRIDAGAVKFRREPVGVKALAARAAEPLAVPMELREQRLIVDVGDERFTGDPDWTTEALGNLLKNCVEHTPAGGTVRLTGSETPLYTMITVEDDGPGFALEDLPHLFERFYRGRGAGADSVGIGLALARSIAAEQGGSLTAENVPGGGARFILRFDKSVI